MQVLFCINPLFGVINCSFFLSSTLRMIKSMITSSQVVSSRLKLTFSFENDSNAFPKSKKFMQMYTAPFICSKIILKAHIDI